MGAVRGGLGMSRLTSILKRLGMDGEKCSVRSGWKWVTLNSSLRVSDSAMSSMGCVCSCDGRRADFEYRFAWRAIVLLMLSAR